MTDAPFLPYGRQTIEEDDVAAVAAALTGEYLTTGPGVAAFDEAFAAAVGARFALSCNSGTAALHLAAMALGLGPGDAAIVPSITFLATANAARYVGAEVVFADVDPRTGLIGPAEFEAALSRVGALRPRAVFPVHLNGQCADVASIRRLAERHGIAVVEDACHALGVRHEKGEPVGSCPHSALAAFSLHPVKAIAMGEGGVVTTNDPELAERVARFRNHGMTRDPARFRDPELAFAADSAAHPWYYEMAEIGFNHRAPDILCALASSQLGKLSRFVARRQVLAERYDGALGRLAPLVEPVPRVSWSGHAFHLYAVRIDFAAAGTTRDAVMAALRARGIGSQVHYIPVHRQPYYRERYGALPLPGADAYYAHCLSLPIFPAMEDSDVDRVVDALAAVLGHGR